MSEKKLILLEFVQNEVREFFSTENVAEKSQHFWTISRRDCLNNFEHFCGGRGGSKVFGQSQFCMNHEQQINVPSMSFVTNAGRNWCPSPFPHFTPKEEGGSPVGGLPTCPGQ